MCFGWRRGRTGKEAALNYRAALSSAQCQIDYWQSRGWPSAPRNVVPGVQTRLLRAWRRLIRRCNLLPMPRRSERKQDRPISGGRHGRLHWLDPRRFGPGLFPVWSLVGFHTDAGENQASNSGVAGVIAEPVETRTAPSRCPQRWGRYCARRRGSLERLSSPQKPGALDPRCF